MDGKQVSFYDIKYIKTFPISDVRGTKSRYEWEKGTFITNIHDFLII